ncbi:hypothetical protein MTO96_016141 [Rhipicephalus appendiculatus]
MPVTVNIEAELGDGRADQRQSLSTPENNAASAFRNPIRKDKDFLCDTGAPRARAIEWDGSSGYDGGGKRTAGRPDSAASEDVCGAASRELRTRARAAGLTSLSAAAEWPRRAMQRYGCGSELDKREDDLGKKEEKQFRGRRRRRRGPPLRKTRARLSHPSVVATAATRAESLYSAGRQNIE